MSYHLPTDGHRQGGRHPVYVEHGFNSRSLSLGGGMGSYLSLQNCEATLSRLASRSMGTVRPEAGGCSLSLVTDSSRHPYSGLALHRKRHIICWMENVALTSKSCVPLPCHKDISIFLWLLLFNFLDFPKEVFLPNWPTCVSLLGLHDPHRSLWVSSNEKPFFLVGDPWQAHVEVVRS